MNLDPCRIAFIHHPFSAKFALLESMPISLNLVKKLDEAGHEIDLYVWEDDNSIYRKSFSKNVRICSLSSGSPSRVVKRKLDWLNFFNLPLIHFDCYRKKKYDCIFGVGLVGSCLARIMSKYSYAPYVYVNDEFPSSYSLPSNSYWMSKERQAAIDASLIIVPDEQRATHLYSELNISMSDVKHAILPNAPLINNHIEYIDWATRLKLPANSIPLLHAGSIADWVQIPEILSSMPSWPEQTVLIINGRTPVNKNYKQELAHLMIEKRIIWTDKPLTEIELNSLVNFSLASFALYRDLGDNIRYIGWSAGKLLRSIKCGRPVIASRYPSLEFIEHNELGKLITHPAEIPAAVDDLIKNKIRYQENCLCYAENELDINKWWLQIVKQLKSVAGIKLS